MKNSIYENNDDENKMSNLKETIRKSYAKLLEKTKKGESGCCESQSESCCGSQNQEISFGCYLMDEELNHFLRKDMTVVDFGSGPGRDLLLAAEIIGPNGNAIGVDMTDEMLDELKQNAEKRNLSNVRAVKADIENIPLEPNSVDVIISNCVINLASDKQKVFSEAFRLLKSGGILLDADVIAEEPLEENLQNDEKLWCSCIGGALTAQKYTELLQKAGFVDVSIKLAEKQEILFESKSLGISSGLIYARKP